MIKGEVSNTLDNVDEFIIAPMWGYKDRPDYRLQCSVHGRLHKIKVPCFYLHAWDDIIVGPKCVPDEEFAHVDNLIFASTAKGGHCCHFS